MSLPHEIITQEWTRFLSFDSLLALRAVSKAYRLILPLPEAFTVLVEMWEESQGMVAVVTLCHGDTGMIAPSPIFVERASECLADWSLVYHHWFDIVPRSQALQAYHGKIDLFLSCNYDLCSGYNYGLCSEEANYLKIEDVLTVDFVEAAIGPLRECDRVSSPEFVDAAFLSYLVRDVAYSLSIEDYRVYLCLDREGKLASLGFNSDEDWEEYYTDYSAGSPTLYILLNVEDEYWMGEAVKRDGFDLFEPVLTKIVAYVVERMKALALSFSL